MRRLALLIALGACRAPVDDTERPTVDPGDLVIEQVGLTGLGLGEAALVIGPDGTSVLIDVANDQHDDDVRGALSRYGLTGVDWVVLTHLHADHIGGVSALFAGDDPIPVHQGLVWRGARNLDDANERELAELLDVFDVVPEVALCDALCALPFRIPLSEDAELVLFLADGELALDAGVETLPVALEEENARSLGGVVRRSNFTYVFAGDLTGGGKDTPNVESAIAARTDRLPWIEPQRADVVHLNHHGISSSTNTDWAAWLFGAQDGNAVVGATSTYLDAPSEEALDALRGRLGTGRVWATDTGVFGGADPLLVNAEGSVTVIVAPDGSYRINGEAFE